MIADGCTWWHHGSGNESSPGQSPCHSSTLAMTLSRPGHRTIQGDYPPRSDTISGRRRRLVVKTSFRFLLKQRTDPRVRKVFTDIGCSAHRARPGSGLEVLPSMTATRAAGRDWWVSTRGSRITTAELFQFQGLEAKHWKMWKDTPGISAGRMRHMLGNSLSCNVAERVFGRALWCAGLVSEQPKDRWEPDDELKA